MGRSNVTCCSISIYDHTNGIFWLLNCQLFLYTNVHLALNFAIIFYYATEETDFV
jgi:hypothetical protein